MTPARIAVDLDGTACAFQEALLERYRLNTGETVRAEDLVEWGSLDRVAQPDVMFAPCDQPGFYADLVPYAGAIAAMARWDAAGHHVYVVTAADHPVAHQDKAWWFRRHLPFLSKRRLVTMHDKWLVPWDVLVDDKPDTIQRHWAAHPAALTAAIEWPYNAGVAHVTGRDYRDPDQAWAEIEAGVNDWLRHRAAPVGSGAASLGEVAP